MVEKGLGLDEKLNMIQQCEFAAQKPNHVLGYIKINVTRKAIAPPAPLFLRSHLEYSIYLWGPQHKKDTRVIRGLKYFPYEDSLSELGLLRLEKKTEMPRIHKDGLEKDVMVSN